MPGGIYLAGRPRAASVTVPAWDGGIVAFRPRMQYPAMTFSAPTRVTFSGLYRPSVTVRRASDDDPAGRRRRCDHSRMGWDGVSKYGDRGRRRSCGRCPYRGVLGAEGRGGRRGRERGQGRPYLAVRYEDGEVRPVYLLLGREDRPDSYGPT